MHMDQEQIYLAVDNYGNFSDLVSTLYCLSHFKQCFLQRFLSVNYF